ncbi:hypothetical protein BV22DRAFT_342083 [Leucogyrophana mollusca]|uniref:Uncharacterized protein n=1 Tax=Leucogyrophana mollusca TaxID=85980 RepID=A0ACB8BKZ7_9AGAM|nr:hypothetical protein BV22DRAFT_342083 [Leucogyrophana mollusca]
MRTVFGINDQPEILSRRHIRTYEVKAKTVIGPKMKRLWGHVLRLGCLNTHGSHQRNDRISPCKTPYLCISGTHSRSDMPFSQCNSIEFVSTSSQHLSSPEFGGSHRLEYYSHCCQSAEQTQVELRRRSGIRQVPRNENMEVEVRSTVGRTLPTV